MAAIDPSEVKTRMTCNLLAVHAEKYSNQVTGKRLGETLVRVETDDGWSTLVRAAGRTGPSSAEGKVLTRFERMDTSEEGIEKMGGSRRKQGPSQVSGRTIDF